MMPVLVDATETAAQTHALLRARAGFNIIQLAAEYRALRASMLRLWMDDCAPETPDLDDVIRFNEAIDQALAESVGFFSSQVEQNRNLLPGMLGHDMRSPLQAIQVTASYLEALNAGERVSEAAARLIRSGARMQASLDDLTDFNRTRLGLGINVTVICRGSGMGGACSNCLEISYSMPSSTGHRTVQCAWWLPVM
jgi:signal transduction histidine kinase